MPQTKRINPKMTIKKFGPKKLRREEWRVQLEKLAKETPLVLHTDAGRTFSMVRRMRSGREDAHSHKPALWFRYLHEKTERRRTR